MALTQISQVANSDLQSLYTTFNNFIQNYSNGIAKLTVPSNNKKVEATDLNNLNTKITAFKSDTYLKTQASWWVNATVTAGNPLKASDWTNINTTVTNMGKVKCKNNATNSKGTNNQTCTKCKNESNVSVVFAYQGKWWVGWRCWINGGWWDVIPDWGPLSSYSGTTTGSNFEGWIGPNVMNNSGWETAPTWLCAVTCQYQKNSNTCSNGTAIYITCSKATNTN